MKNLAKETLQLMTLFSMNIAGKNLKIKSSPRQTEVNAPTPTEGCMGEQATLEFDLTFSDVLLHKFVKTD